MTNRRKFLIGLGAATTGSAAAFGTAASTTFNLNDRNVGANITTDSSGAVALNSGTKDGNEIVNQTGGELEIDFTQGGAAGVNVGSEVRLGNNFSPKNSAFSVTNQTSGSANVTIQFEAGDDFSANSNGSELIFVFDNKFSVGGNNRPKEIVVTADSVGNPRNRSEVVSGFNSPGDTGSVAYDGNQEVPAGGTIVASLIVNADETNSDPSENLSGTLNITATQD